MRFNWDNPHIIINHWLPLAGGEFVNRCLSMSSKMVIISSLEDIRRQIDDLSDYDLKLDIFKCYQPKNDGWWHDVFLDSRQWLAMRPDANPSPENDGLFFENIWQDSHLTTREFYDRFWRPISCELSNRNIGMMMKTHRDVDVIGLQNLLPQSKVTTCISYNEWKDRCINMNKTPGTVLSAYDDNDELPSDFPAFRFKIDDLMDDVVSFESQMQSAYKYLGLDDFRSAKSSLLEMRKIYLRWHLEWKRKT